METWLEDNLSKILDFAVPPEFVEYIMKIENEADLDAYLETLLDYRDPKHRQFVANLKRKRNEYFSSKWKKANEEKTQNKNDKKKGKSSKSKDADIIKADKKEVQDKVGKKKTKFVNLYSEEGNDRSILLKGRHKCDCEAKQHKLINNCLNCGRIVCMQEGPGPCFFCGELVCSPDQQKILQSDSRQADSLWNQLMEQKPNKSLEESIKHRDKLLEFDRNSEQRTRVIDDESDYFQATTNTWLSKEEREAMKKKDEEMMARKHQSRLQRKITFDFAGREIIDEDNNFDMNEEEMKKVVELSQNREFIFPDTELPLLPTYIPIRKPEYNVKCNTRVNEFNNRIQDKEYLEMSDDGMCLSMHQPYASLLVAGIKEHEGRTWYSAHRGRLWIASAAKVPNMEEISALENHYRVLKNENLKFPQHYPTSCLLGCVTVVDVLPQEEYRKKFPEGESESPYVFICEDFYELPIRFPIQGKYKIYKLDEKIHRAAVNALEKTMQKKLNENDD